MVGWDVVLKMVFFFSDVEHFVLKKNYQKTNKTRQNGARQQKQDEGTPCLQ